MSTVENPVVHKTEISTIAKVLITAFQLIMPCIIFASEEFSEDLITKFVPGLKDKRRSD